jgi:putative membrane-bound dehydrogenase-like protein
MLAVAILCFSVAALAADAPTKPPSAADGQLPLGLDGRPLNLDFERGTLDDWVAVGDAFTRQPVQGDMPTARGRGMKSDHAGRYWIGGFEALLDDRPQGTLTSAPFKVTQPYASFRIAGGAQHETRVELVRRDNQQVFFSRSGDNTETLKPVVVDLRPVVGQEIYIRLVDASSGGWGHVNFDDFKLHATRPNFAGAATAQLPDEYPYAGLSPAEAAKVMEVPDGFKVTLVAGEPEVKQPIAQAIDHRGRLWIAEAYTYPHRAPEGQGKDRILIFEDQDGDGSFETSKVFVEGLNLVSGLEVGFGGVWVGAAPYLLFVPDRDGDDTPDGPAETLLDGWHYEDTHETLNTFTWGPDGWLYGCHGVFTHSQVGKPGAAANERTPINAGIWRYHPTRHVFEVFAGGTSNPWGVDFNDYGQCFCTACVIPHLYHIIQGGRYQRQAGTHFNPYTFDDIKTIAVHRHWLGDTPHAGNNRSDAAGGGHAHAGAMIYLGGSWPTEYRDQIFMNNIHGQRINQDRISPKGSGYEGNRAPDFCLSRDRWSQILNLQMGPDGQCYMIDWYDANACHHRDTNGHDRTNGRIFRVAYHEAKMAKVDLAKLDDEQLVELQLNPNDWHVRHARRVLQERGAIAPAAREKLVTMAFEHPDETRRVRALWALHVSGGLRDAEITRGLKNDQPHVRAWTIQLALEDSTRAPSDDVLAPLADMARSDSSGVVRLYLASAMQRLPRSARWAIGEGLLAHSQDAADHNLPLMVWYGVEPLAGEDAQRALRLASEGKIPLVFNFMVRRIAKIGTPAALELLVAALGRSKDDARRLAILQATSEGLKGRRQVPMPKSWPDVGKNLFASHNAMVAADATSLAVTFGDPAALDKLRGVVLDADRSSQERKQALDALLAVKDRRLAPSLQRLVADRDLRSAALRGLAAYDDAATPGVILKAYSQFSSQEKRDALATLAARTPWASALLAAVADKRIAATDLSADLVRQLRNLKDPTINDRIGELWGQARESSAEKAEAISSLAALVKQNGPPADAALGRAVFAKTCQQCHTLFGIGSKIGPELTGSNRANLEYLLSNIVDPSAVMAKEYQPTVLVAGGRVITGLVREEDANAVTLQTANELVVVPRDEIEQRQISQQSMMPDDLLKPLAPGEIRALVAYLASPAQVSMLATAENLKNFFNGTDLAGWQGKPSLWRVEQGELVGSTAGLQENEFLTSELVFGDFRLKLQVHLLDNEGNSGIQFRSEPIDDGRVKGYQADIGQGWWGKLYEELGRGLLWSQSGESHVKPGWNTYEIQAVGSKIRTWINGQLCVDLEDTGGERRGVFALQLHSGGPTEVRFKDFEIELSPEPR